MFNNTLQRSAILALALTACVTTNLAKAQSDGQGGKRRGPPAEAIEACASSSEGDSCSFAGRGGDTIEGSCIVPRSEDSLACAPEGGPPDHEGRKGEANSSD